MLGRCFFLFLFGISTTCLFAQHQDRVDFMHAKVNIDVNPESKQIQGDVTYGFKVLESVDSVFLDARNMTFQAVWFNHRKKRLNYDGQHLVLHHRFKKGKNYTIDLQYSTKPKQTVYFMGVEDGLKGNEQVWTQGQGKYTSHWLPSFDDMEEKVEFDLNLSIDADYEVIANGVLKTVRETDDLKKWSFDMKQPMSSYLVAFAIGNYDKQEVTSTSGVPIENYYYPQDSLKVEPTYRYTKEIFDFLETEIGVAYPWQNYKQVPVRDFLYAGMENTGATLFSDGYVIDSIAFVDKNYVNVNAHELAHQWFGDLVTEKNGSHHWLHEGFATYYAYLAEKEIFGDDYFYWKLYDTAQQLNDQSKDGKGEPLTDPKASSLTFYEKGAWALVMLRNQIGDEAFKNGIKNYLQKYQFKNVTIEQFMSEMELVSKSDLTTFKKEWLDAPSFPFEKVQIYLTTQSTSVATFIKLKWELTTSLADKTTLLQKYWVSADPELKARIIAKYHKSFSNEMMLQGFNSNAIKIRQALALAYDRVPLYLQAQYETLLDDKSYLTKEIALYRLWISFPQHRAHYLDRTKGIIGLPNKNVRMLWLLLTTLTKDYDTELKEGYLTELFAYTAPKYDMETRQIAFGILIDVFELQDQNLLDLINASVHHSWQFRKYARDLLDVLLKDDKQRKRIIALSKGLNEEELRYIRTKLEL
ncbi:MAG: M1 family metallopeptidase [Maribacter sp.]|uniref:M1 family metallopeptidase n=1 Tax=Maribacter sp. TaxID=1897614 RepID=UPI003C728D68